MIRSPGMWLSSTVAVAYPAELLGKAVGIMGEKGLQPLQFNFGVIVNAAS